MYFNYYLMYKDLLSKKISITNYQESSSKKKKENIILYVMYLMFLNIRGQQRITKEERRQ